MKKNSNKVIMETNEIASKDYLTSEFELFKSRVANAVLDYMEAQDDPELIECLEKASIFLTNISFQMEKVFDNQKHVLKDQNDMFEIGDDLFSVDSKTSSSTFH